MTGFDLRGIDGVEFYVGNAKQAARAYHALGFRPVAYRGLETGCREVSSWCVEQGGVRLVLTAALERGHPIADHVAEHGDGVRDVALRVGDARAAYEHALAHGATGVREPEVLQDDEGSVAVAAIATCGDVIHSLVERDGYAGPHLPGYEPVEDGVDRNGVGIHGIDHATLAVSLGEMDECVDFYRDVMGFGQLHHFSDEQVSSDYSALMSKVMANGDKVKFPICEPAEGLRKSQVDEFLDFNRGPGVQHLAFLCDDVVSSVAEMRRGGVDFLPIPAAYYDDISSRVPEVAEQVAQLRDAHVLGDRDEDGYLLQIFSRSLGDRPTFFIELIERHGARGFGAGNFRALFEALEAEQALRGNL